jgi:predicted DNA-binding WGR domain protein
MKQAIHGKTGLRTEMIIARDKKRAMNVFWVLEFSEIELTMERHGWRRP